MAVCFSFPYGGIIPRCDIIWVIYADFEPHFFVVFRPLGKEGGR
uniref:Uncharacterized protein n=1 Tax=Myoviridae sp. ctNYa18 TaxID=2825090 RepID=A0A8S5PFV3_9CAUD|nr:MAG TPA: hypothetical protein [Myoviridae sp. ctNYa18]DAI27477.1 MAG TPA: hypothetical protein [Caudoviricetes sp.]